MTPRAAAVERHRGFASTIFAVWCALLILALATALRAEEATNARFHRILPEDGLSQAVVTAVVQDHSGFMWFGTQEGLNRYDGYEFKIFRHDAHEPGSLSHDSIRALYVDRQGTLWVGTDGGGLNRYDPVEDTFSHFRFDLEDPTSLSDDRVRAILEDRSGILWIGTEGGGLNRFDRDTGLFEAFNHDPANPESLSHNRVSSLFEGPDGVLWVGTDGGGLERFDPQAGGPFQHYRHDPDLQTTLSDNRIRTLTGDEDGTLWIGTYEGGLNRLDPASGMLTRFLNDPEDPTSLSANRVRGIFRDRSEVLWIGTDNGLNALRSDGLSFAQFRSDPEDLLSLSDDRVISIFQDRGGVLWVGTYRGLNKWNSTLGGFTHHRPVRDSETGPSSDVVTAFHDDTDGSIWIGTYGGGLNRWNRVTGTYEYFRHDPGDPNSLSDDRVSSILVDGKGTLWVGTFTGGLNRFDRATRSFTRWRHDPENHKTLSDDGITAIVKGGRGDLWIGTYRAGLNRFDSSSGLVSRYRHDSENPTSLSSDRVVALHLDGEGVLWVGTDGGGLSRMDVDRGRFSHYRHSPDNPWSLSSDHVWAIHGDATGVLWIGTQGGGLNRWLPSERTRHRGRFEHFAYRDGLPSSVVYGILSDRRGNVWLSTNRGISRFNPRTGVIKNYNRSHGLQGEDFNSGAYFRSQSGEMFFGGSSGFNVFLPEAIADNAHVPPVVLTSFLKLNQPVNLGSTLAEVEGLQLSHRDYVVAFEFAALDYTEPESNRYMYQLVGFDQEWVDAGSRRRATYTNLPAGAYTFRVKASNNDGLWNDQGTAVRVAVAPAPWDTWWAWSLYGLVATIALVLNFRSQIRKRQRAEELEEANVALANEVTERQNAEEELRKLSRAVEQSPASVIITDPKGRIEYVNPKFESVTGYVSHEVVGRRLDILKSGYTAPERAENLWQTITAGSEWRGEFHNRKKNGELFWEYASVSPIKGENGEITHFLSVNEDITVRKDYEERLLHQANFDQLTGLPNRILALDRLSRALLQNRRKNRLVAVMFVDLDNFKIVNDTMGHEAGDHLLKTAAGRLSEAIRESDTVARLGGDEFLVVAPDLSDVLAAENAVGRVLDCFAPPFEVGDREIFVTASVGITIAPSDGEDAHVLMRNADAAMYKAKEKGRDAYQFFTPSMNEHAMRRLRVESNLRLALERHELSVHYQPIVEAETGILAGAEALLRWQNSELGTVPPDQFVPIAEDTGLIVPIGNWVLRTVCRQAMTWSTLARRPLQFTVNVSSRQFKGSDLTDMVSQALRESGLPPEYLVLELTERVLIEDAAESQATLARLHEMGVGLSVDDFGTGYSALSYLKKFPFDILKIDQSFVRELVEDSDDAALVTAMIGIGRSLGLKVTAEGVETEEQLDFLKSQGCGLIQGFYFSRAVSAASFGEILARGNQRILAQLGDSATGAARLVDFRDPQLKASKRIAGSS